MPTNATWFAFPGIHLIVDFQHQLEPGPVDHTNWTAVHGLTNYIATAAAVAGNQVTIQMLNNGIGFGANRCTYAPPPFDVRTPHGTPAAAFVDFPIT